MTKTSTQQIGFIIDPITVNDVLKGGMSRMSKVVAVVGKAFHYKKRRTIFMNGKVSERGAFWCC